MFIFKGETRKDVHLNLPISKVTGVGGESNDTIGFAKESNFACTYRRWLCFVTQQGDRFIQQYEKENFIIVRGEEVV